MFTPVRRDEQGIAGLVPLIAQGVGSCSGIEPVIKQNKIGIRPKLVKQDSVCESSISDASWRQIDTAFRERVEAVELFMADVAGRFRFRASLNQDSWIVARIEAERDQLTSQLPNFQRRVWLAAADLVCDSGGDFWFVDDHYCCPLGLYKYSNLLATTGNPTSQSEFSAFVHETQQAIRKHHSDENSTVVLGSSTFNTVYREHRYIAELLDVPYATRQRLHIEDGRLMCTTGATSQRVQTLVRRLQDEDLDSSCYRVDSLQGVCGLVRAAQRGQVRLLNAAGTGLFNHRAICSLIPRMIRFYLGKDPVLPTIPTAPTFDADFPAAANDYRNHIFRTDNAMDVLRPLVGSTSSAEDRADYFAKVTAKPNAFVARSTVEHASGGSADAQYALRIFCTGTSRRTVFRGGLRRACRQDGTPIFSIATDESASCAHVDADLSIRL